MGQYFIIVNKQLDEYINPHEFGDGAKLLEFGSSGAGTMTALALLLRQSSEGGGGDYYGDDTEYVGRWAGCKIVIVGDYDESELYDIAQNESEYTNVSKGIRDIMVDDLGYKYKIHEEGGFVSRGE